MLVLIHYSFKVITV